MDRLTERNKLGEALLNANLNEKYYPSELIDILDRLTAYKNTGLSPEEIREMLTDWLVWKQAEAEGRLAVLPCKPEATVYGIRKSPKYGKYVKELTASAVGVIAWKDRTDTILITTKEDYYGKTVFLTHEEAEKALEVK